MKFCTCCQKQVTAAFPPEVKAHTQYGNRVRSWVVYYQNQQLIPEDRIQQLFMDMYNLPILIEHDKESWAGRMSKLLKLMLRCRHRYGDRFIPQYQTRRLERIYDTIVEQGLAWHESLPPLVLQKINRGRPKQRPGHNLLLRLSNHREEVLGFLHDPKVPYYK